MRPQKAQINSYEDMNERRRKYIESKGIKFNPEKFVRKHEVQGAFGAIYYSLPKEERTPEVERFYEQLKSELKDVETLAQEINRRIKQDDEHDIDLTYSEWN